MFKLNDNTSCSNRKFLLIFFWGGKGRNFIVLKLMKLKNKTTLEKMNARSHGFNFGSENRKVFLRVEK